MVIRGAPAIGVAAAMGIARGALDSKAQTFEDFERDFHEAATVIAGTRPTAVNLFWAVDRMTRLFNNMKAEGATQDQIKQRLVVEAKAIFDEDLKINARLGRLGGTLIPNNSTVLTH